MNNESQIYLKYPIGKVNLPDTITQTQIISWIRVLENFPEQLIDLTKNLTKSQLDTTYRPLGWTIRQVVHHLADSHHISYTRFKWALTEDKPVIKAYYEDRWAELIDGKSAPIELSLNAISSLHAKWVYLIEGLDKNDLKKVFIHPDGNKKVSLAQNIGIYAWHCEHHFAHIKNLIKNKGWG
jgi:hypothetical protein